MMDKELDDLLDSALNDFDHKLVINETSPIQTDRDGKLKENNEIKIEKLNLYVDDVDYEDRPQSNQTNKTSTNLNLNDENLKLFEEIFNEEKNKESLKQFQDVFSMFQNSTNEKNLLENFQKVMSELVNEEANLEEEDEFSDFENIEELNFFKNLTASSKVDKESCVETKDNLANNPDISNNKINLSPLQKVLDNMNKNSEKILKNSNNEGFPFGSEFFSTLNSLNSNENNDDNLDGATSLMMQPILSMLFSKDILYPSLKLMLDNYDKYLVDKKNQMNQSELNKCLEQKDYIKKMCDVYEKSCENDSKETKTEQLKEILDLLEKCGMPPKELVPDVNPFEGIGDQMKNNGCPIS
jgi:hypothetical protein